MANHDAGLDATKYKLKAFENAAAGHDGVLSDEDGEVIIKPCTQAEIDFYQASAVEHPDFYELMPTFLGTLQLGRSAAIPETIGADSLTTTEAAEPISEEFKDQTLLHGKALATETAIVLANLEHGFTRPNVLDLKLGARLYDPASTKPEKAARLDGVAAATTSGALHFRITGMKVWNAQQQAYDVYDKFYGRKFSAESVGEGFATFFDRLIHGGLSVDEARDVLVSIRAEVLKAQQALEQTESRFYGASVLVVYEGDAEALRDIVQSNQTVRLRPQVDTTMDEQLQQTAIGEDSEDEAEDEDDEEYEMPVTHRVSLIDFAHAAWTPGAGADENVILGLKNIGDQLDHLIAQAQREKLP